MRVVIVKELLTTTVEVEADSDELAIEKAKSMIDRGEVNVVRDCEEVSRVFEIGMSCKEIESRISNSGMLFR